MIGALVVCIVTLALALLVLLVRAVCDVGDWDQAYAKEQPPLAWRAQVSTFTAICVAVALIAVTWIMVDFSKSTRIECAIENRLHVEAVK